MLYLYVPAIKVSEILPKLCCVTAGPKHMYNIFIMCLQ